MASYDEQSRMSIGKAAVAVERRAVDGRGAVGGVELCAVPSGKQRLGFVYMYICMMMSARKERPGNGKRNGNKTKKKPLN